MALTGNKGEWSEIYVLFKLLGEKKIFAGDGDLNKLEVFYPVIKVLRDELKRHLEYSIDKDIVIVTEDGNEISRINIASFLEQSKILFAGIQNGDKGKGAFDIPSIETFLGKIHCKKLKAKSLDKADIHIIIHDYHTGLTPNLGFSIKSDAGALPTLLNASNATTFVFRLIGSMMDDNKAAIINQITGNRKVQDRIAAIYDAGSVFEYSGVANHTFLNNLSLIDSKLPDIIGWMLPDCYLHRNMNIKDAIMRITASNPLGFDSSEGHDFYGFKMKSLMVCSALGMLPSKPWNGKYEATGGYIVVKNDGDIICFHIYDRNLLEDYLIKNTKFETPKSERYNTGSIYKGDDGAYYFNLVLQIRFSS